MELAGDNCHAGVLRVPCGVVWLCGHLHCLLKVALRQPSQPDWAATLTVSGKLGLSCGWSTLPGAGYV